MGRLNERTAVITGAGRGIGAVMARHMAGEGANVVVSDVLDTADTVAAI
ncbi:MAG: SDR family NAD(P)-dependent oxidoreductase, partial [Boseongicola sp.]|nr:SDR family NAD(P)-dependent oxidoreductase [Boseongicola sp.]